MNKKLQLKFISDNYPETTNHISKRKIRHTFFENIRTEVQSYLLGFFASDGSIDEKRKTFRVELQNGDAEIIYLIRDLISKEARVFFTKPKLFIGPRGKIVYGHGSIGIDITSAILCRSLVNLGYGYRKSYSELNLPNIDKYLIKHFIRGYFDGDGSIICWYKKPEGTRKARICLRFEICSKTSTLLLEIQKFFFDNDILTYININKRDKMYKLLTASYSEVKKIYDLLYNDANFYLTRKYNKYNHYVNTEKSQLITELCNALKMNVKKSNNSSTSTEHPNTKGKDENIC